MNQWTPRVNCLDEKKPRLRGFLLTFSPTKHRIALQFRITHNPTGKSMPTKIYSITSSEWTKVTTNEQSGSYLKIGNRTIVLHQGQFAPIEDASSAPTLDIVSGSDPVPFFDIPSNEAIYARTTHGESELHITGGKTHAIS